MYDLAASMACATAAPLPAGNQRQKESGESNIFARRALPVSSYAVWQFRDKPGAATQAGFFPFGNLERLVTGSNIFRTPEDRAPQ